MSYTEALKKPVFPAFPKNVTIIESSDNKQFVEPIHFMGGQRVNLVQRTYMGLGSGPNFAWKFITFPSLSGNMILQACLIPREKLWDTIVHAGATVNLLKNMVVMILQKYDGVMVWAHTSVAPMTILNGSLTGSQTMNERRLTSIAYDVASAGADKPMKLNLFRRRRVKNLDECKLFLEEHSLIYDIHRE
jgi:hypothetical protein